MRCRLGQAANLLGMRNHPEEVGFEFHHGRFQQRAQRRWASGGIGSSFAATRYHEGSHPDFPANQRGSSPVASSLTGANRA
jgi:hypothetical protein